MTIGGIPGSVIGFGRIDHSAIIDYNIIGLVGSATIVSADMLAALTQSTPSALKPSATIEIDGVDVSDSCGRFKIKLIGNGGHSMVEIPVLSDSLSIDLHQSVVSITIKYTLSTGTVFSQERFRGLAHIIDREQKIGTSGYLLTCFDLGYKLSQNPPSTTWVTTMSALDIINGELAYYGFAPAYGSFVDYDMGGVNLTYFKTAADIINFLVNGRRLTSSFWDMTGAFKLTDYNDTTVLPWTFPLTCQSSQTPIKDGTDRYNQVPLTGESPYTYNDLTDQATKNVMPHPGLDVPWSTQAQSIILGTSIADNSYRNKYLIRGVLNPFVFPGDVVTMTLADSTTKVVRVLEITDFCGFPGGFWSEILVRSTS